MFGYRLALALTGWIALAATRLPDASPPRIAIAALFLLLCPCAALVRIVAAVHARSGRRLDLLETAVLTVTLSLAAGALVSEAFYLTGTFTLTRATAVLAALTSAAALCPTPRARTATDKL
jgi:uncharacterized membrane protein